MTTTSTVALAAVLLAQTASADILACSWNSTGNFHYRVVHMPDLDQRRSALPGNGSMYCAPTSTLNLFCYAANHGYPSVYPGPQNWESSSSSVYNSATSAISFLGSVMGTDAQDGTAGSGTAAGTDLLASSSGVLATVRRTRTASYTPTVAKMTQLACQGWVMSFAYGRYEIIGSINGHPYVNRVGGHAVTFNRADRDNNEYVMRYRDPADDDSLGSQGVFSNKIVYPVAYTAAFAPTDVRTMNAIAYPSSDGKVRIIDSYWGIRPKYAMFFINTSNLAGLNGGTIKLVDPTPLQGSANLILPEIAISNFTTLEGMAFHPDMSEGLVLTRSIFVGQPSLLRKLDFMTGGMITLPDAPINLVQIAPSREGFIYSFDAEGTLFKLDSEGAIVDDATTLPPLSSIWFDDVSDTLRLLSVSDRRILKVSKTLVTTENLIVPTSVPMSGIGSVRVDPTTGKSWFKTDASALLYNVAVGGAGPLVTSIPLPTLPGGLRSFQFGDRGELYLLGESIMKVLKRQPNGSWQEDPTSPFHNLPGGQQMMFVNNTTNEDPAIHDGPAWHNIPAEDLLDIGVNVPDCNADFDGNDLVDGADLGFLLGKWGSAAGAADLNQDGTVDGADLGALLGSWGSCL